MAELEANVGFLLMHEPTLSAPVSAKELDANQALVPEQVRKGNMKEDLNLFRQKHQVNFVEAKKTVEELRAGLGLWAHCTRCSQSAIVCNS